MGPLFKLAVVGIIGAVARCCALKEGALGNFEEKKMWPGDSERLAWVKCYVGNLGNQRTYNS